MSEMMFSGGEKRDATCPSCSGPCIERKTFGVYGMVCWVRDGHDAPCGLPCFGAGVAARAYRTGAFHHNQNVCPRCKP